MTDRYVTRRCGVSVCARGGTRTRACEHRVGPGCGWATGGPDSVSVLRQATPTAQISRLVLLVSAVRCALRDNPPSIRGLRASLVAARKAGVLCGRETARRESPRSFCFLGTATGAWGLSPACDLRSDRCGL